MTINVKQGPQAQYDFASGSEHQILSIDFLANDGANSAELYVRSLWPSLFSVLVGSMLLIGEHTAASAQWKDKNIEACSRPNPADRPAWCGGENSPKSSPNPNGAEAARILNEIWANDRQAREEGQRKRQEILDQSETESALPSRSYSALWLESALASRREAARLENLGQYREAGVKFLQAHNLAHRLSDRSMGQETLIGYVRTLQKAGLFQKSCSELNTLFTEYPETIRHQAIFRDQYGCSGPNGTPTVARSAPRTTTTAGQKAMRATPPAEVNLKGGFQNFSGRKEGSASSIDNPKNSEARDCIQVTEMPSARILTVPSKAENCNPETGHCYETQFTWKIENICRATMVVHYDYGSRAKMAFWLKGGTADQIKCSRNTSPCDGKFQYGWKVAD